MHISLLRETHGSGDGLFGILLDSAHIARIFFSAGEEDSGLTNNELDRETMSGEFIFINCLVLSHYTELASFEGQSI